MCHVLSGGLAAGTANKPSCSRNPHTTKLHQGPGVPAPGIFLGSKANYTLLHAPSGNYELEVMDVTLDPNVWSPGSIEFDESFGTYP